MFSKQLVISSIQNLQIGEQSVCPELLCVIRMERSAGLCALEGVPPDSRVIQFCGTLLSIPQQKSIYWSNGIPLMRRSHEFSTTARSRVGKRFATLDVGPTRYCDVVLTSWDRGMSGCYRDPPALPVVGISDFSQPL